MHDNFYCYSNTKHVHVKFIAYSFKVFLSVSLILFKVKLTHMATKIEVGDINMNALSQNMLY